MNRRRKILSSTREGNKIVSKIIFILLTAILIIFIAFYFNYDKVSADINNNRNKQVVSIRIEKGDTLWKIAKDYITEEYGNINEYIDEIKLSNGLDTDNIYEGSYIIVPYYVDSESIANHDNTP